MDEPTKDIMSDAIEKTFSYGYDTIEIFKYDDGWGCVVASSDYDTPWLRSRGCASPLEAVLEITDKPRQRVSEDK